MSENDFDKQLWVRLVKKYYNQIEITKKVPSEVIRISVMMEIESFAEWLQENGNLKDFEP